MSEVMPDSSFTTPDTICHQWRKQAVVVDRVAGTVEFRHCHIPRGNIVFPKSQSYFSCAISDLKAVHFTPRFKNNSAFLTVVTTTGKAIVPDKGTHFAALREWFAEAVPNNDPAFATDNPMILFVYVVAGTISLFTAAFLTERAGNGAMAVAGLLGAVFGIVGTRLLVHLGGRLLRTDINYGIVAIIAGVIICAAVSRYFDWNIALAIGIGLTGAFYGLVSMVRKVPKKIRAKL